MVTILTPVTFKSPDVTFRYALVHEQPFCQSTPQSVRVVEVISPYITMLIGAAW